MVDPRIGSVERELLGRQEGWHDGSMWCYVATRGDHVIAGRTNDLD